MEYSEKIFEKKFSDDISKNAYLKACKWLAKNVYNKVELVDYIFVQIKKDKENQLPTFIVSLYATIDIKEFNNNFCKKCKSMYSIFYSIDKPKCEECKKHVYDLEIKKQISSIKEFLENMYNEGE